MTDLLRQLHGYGEQLETRMEALDVEDVRFVRVGSGPVRPILEREPRSAGRLLRSLQQRLSGETAPAVTIGWFEMEKPRAKLTGRRGLAVAAAALVVALGVALPLWLLRGGGDEPPFVDRSSTAPDTTGTVPTTAPSMATGDTFVVSELPWDGPVPRVGHPVLAVSADEAWFYALDPRGHLIHLDSDRTSHLPLPPAVDWLMGLAVTPDGTLWAATNVGVLSYDGEAWTLQLAGELIRALAVTEDGTVWAGGFGGYENEPLAESYWLARWDGRAFVRVDPNPETVPAYGFMVMSAGADGVMWMASTGYVQTDLYRYDAGSFEAVQIGDYEDRNPDGPSGPVGVFDVAIAPNGDVWVGGFVADDWDQVVLARYDGAEWTTFDWPFADRSANDEVLFFGLAVALDGTVWVDFPGGLGSYDGNTWSVRLVTMAESGTATAIDIAPDGTIWYFDQGGLHTLSTP